MISRKEYLLVLNKTVDISNIKFNLSHTSHARKQTHTHTPHSHTHLYPHSIHTRTHPHIHNHTYTNTQQREFGVIKYCGSDEPRVLISAVTTHPHRIRTYYPLLFTHTSITPTLTQSRTYTHAHTVCRVPYNVTPRRHTNTGGAV